MKKIFVLFLAIFAMAYFSMPAFATTGSVTMGDTSVDLSANVDANYYGGTGTNYSADTYNPKGVGIAYGVTSDSTYIFYKDGINTTTVKTATDLNDKADSSAFSGWSQLGGTGGTQSGTQSP